jgi:hypothetical protein
MAESVLVISTGSKSNAVKKHCFLDAVGYMPFFPFVIVRGLICDARICVVGVVAALGYRYRS